MAAKKKPAKPKPKAKVTASVAPPSLNFKHRLFVAAYLGDANGSATEAARMAGYAQPHSQGPRLLNNVGVRAAIDAKLSHVAMRPDEVLARLSDMASVDMDDFTDVNKLGFNLNLLKARAAGKLHLVKKLSHNQFGVVIELHDSQAALEKLARYHALFRDRLEITDVTARDAVEEMDEAAERYEREHSDEAGTGQGGAGEMPDGPGAVQ